MALVLLWLWRWKTLKQEKAEHISLSLRSAHWLRWLPKWQRYSTLAWGLKYWFQITLTFFMLEYWLNHCRIISFTRNSLQTMFAEIWFWKENKNPLSYIVFVYSCVGILLNHFMLIKVHFEWDFQIIAAELWFHNIVYRRDKVYKPWSLNENRYLDFFFVF